MIEMSVSGLAIDERTHTPVVLLKEREGTRMLPIWIGQSSTDPPPTLRRRRVCRITVAAIGAGHGSRAAPRRG